MGVDFIHIGYPKCASSWLQEVFFRGHPQLNVLGDPNDDEQQVKDFYLFTQSLVGSGVCEFKPEEFREGVLSLLRQKVSSCGVTGGKVQGLSAEGYIGRFGDVDFNAKSIIAKKLNKAFSDAKVVIIFREQRKLIESSYVEFVRQGGFGSLHRYLQDPFFTRSFSCHNNVVLTTPVLNIQYSHLVSYYEKLFGAEKVLALPLELLSYDPDVFTQRLCAFLGVAPFTPEKVNKVRLRHTDLSLMLLGMINRCMSSRYQSKGVLSWPLALFLRKLSRYGKSWNNHELNPFFVEWYLSEGVINRISSFLMKVESRMPWLHRIKLRNYHYNALPVSLRNYIERMLIVENQHLQKKVDMDLSKFGYWMGE